MSVLTLPSRIEGPLPPRSSGHGGTWKPPWVGCGGVNPTLGVAMNATYQQGYGEISRWFGGSGGASGSKGGCHLGSIHGGPAGNFDLIFDPALVSSPCVSSPVPHLGSASSQLPSAYSSNISWISRACGKSLPCESWGGVVNGDLSHKSSSRESPPSPWCLLDLVVDGGERASVPGEEGRVVDVHGTLAMCGTIKGGVAGGLRELGGAG
jgi:hypothetical protein